LYFGVLALTAAVLTLFPIWRGSSYSKYGTSAWHSSGSFGLRGVLSATNQAPIWNPPAPWSGPRGNERDLVRLPWQPITQTAHVEIELWIEALLLACAVVVCGLLLRLAYRLAGRPPDRFVWLAWSDAAGVLLFSAAEFLMLVLTLGALLEEYEWVFVAGPFVGAVIGLAYGLSSWRRRSAGGGSR